MPLSRLLPHRVAGDLSLDFANTYSWRGTEREVDHLSDADAVLAWARESGLIDDGDDFSPGETTKLLREARLLRRAIEEAATSITTGSEPPPSALAVIRNVASHSLAEASLAGTPVQLSFKRTDRVLGPIAWAALDLLRGQELDRLKQCPPDDCRWLFIDRTKNRSRRWCDMATCGNRAKKRLIV